MWFHQKTPLQIPDIPPRALSPTSIQLATMPSGSRQRRAAGPAVDKAATNLHTSKAPSPPASSVTSAVSTPTSSHLKGRAPRQAGNSMSDAVDELTPLLDVETTTQPEPTSRMGATTWIGLALASGACAAFNGVFAKLWVDFIRVWCAGNLTGWGLTGLLQDNNPAHDDVVSGRCRFSGPLVRRSWD